MSLLLQGWNCKDDCGGGTSLAAVMHTLTVQSPSGTAGDDGHFDPTDSDNWTTEGTIRGSFTSRGGREFIKGQKVSADVSHVIEVPSTSFSRSIQPEWRVRFDSRTFQVVAAYDVNEARQTVRIEVREAK